MSVMITRYAALAAVFFAASAASAQGSASDTLWAGCGENPISKMTTFMVGPKAAKARTPKVLPEIGHQRCTLALDDPAMANAPWQRRASLLRSRARFALLSDDAEGALADLDLIKSIEQPDTVYTRSFGLSLLMLRALALAQTGQFEAATVSAMEAAKLRPWSDDVAAFAAFIGQLDGSTSADETQFWTQAIRVLPSNIEQRARVRSETGDWAGALHDWKQAESEPGSYGKAMDGRGGKFNLVTTEVDVTRTGQAALAAAMTGEIETARKWLAAARNAIESPPPNSDTPYQPRISAEKQTSRLAAWEGLVEAAGAYKSGNAPGAAERVYALKNLPANMMVVQMLSSIAEALPTANRAGLLRDVPSLRTQILNGQRKAADNDVLRTFLLADMPEHEDVAATNRYRSSILFLRASGFKDTLRKDGTGATIKYFGDKSTPLAVGEMALLRAAELAQKSGKPAFLIRDRSDYRTTSTPTMHGSPIGPTVTAGYGSQIEIDFLDSISADNDRAIDAAALRAALEPIYIRADGAGS
jgi:hypothetical protein